MDIKILHFLETTKVGDRSRNAYPVYMRIYYRARYFTLRSRLVEGMYTEEEWQTRYEGQADVYEACQREKLQIEIVVTRAAGDGVYNVREILRKYWTENKQVYDLLYARWDQAMLVKPTGVTTAKVWTILLNFRQFDPKKEIDCVSWANPETQKRFYSFLMKKKVSIQRSLEFIEMISYTVNRI